MGETSSYPLTGGRRLLQFFPFYFVQPSIQRLPRAHQTRPRPDADELHAGSLIRVYQVTVVFVADVSPDIIQDRSHDRQSKWSQWSPGKEGLGGNKQS